MMYSIWSSKIIAIYFKKVLYRFILLLTYFLIINRYKIFFVARKTLDWEKSDTTHILPQKDGC